MLKFGSRRRCARGIAPGIWRAVRQKVRCSFQPRFRPHTIRMGSGMASGEVNSTNFCHHQAGQAKTANFERYRDDLRVRLFPERSETRAEWMVRL